MKLTRHSLLVLLPVLFIALSACSRTSTIKMSGEYLPPRGAEVTMQKGEWEFEAEILHSDVNAMHVEQDGLTYAIPHDAVTDIDYPGDGLIHGGFGVMLASLPVGLGGFVLLMTATLVEEDGSAAANRYDSRGPDPNARAFSGFLAFGAPVLMLATGIGMIVYGFDRKDEMKRLATRPKVKETGLPFLIAPWVDPQEETTWGLRLQGRF